MLEDGLALLRLSHLVPEVGIVRELLFHQVDLVLVLLLHEHLLCAPEETLLAHDFTGTA